jgi:hypothetical protein
VRTPRYDAARAALAEAYAEVCAESLRDSSAIDDDERAAAIDAWARLARDEDLIRWAMEIKRRAERKMGELLRDIAEGADEPRKQRVPSRRQIDAEGLGRTSIPAFGVAAVLDRPLEED